MVGNTMIDTLLRFRDAARGRGAAARLGVEGGQYAVLTLHRPTNVDELDQLGEIVDAVCAIARRVPVVFPVHPRTRSRFRGTHVEEQLVSEPGIVLTEPLGYLDFVSLLDGAAVVLTDSGGIQEETTVLGIPCLTLRESTERPVTVTSGTNTVVGTDVDAIVGGAFAALDGAGGPALVPELWDGRAAERLVAALARDLREDPLAIARGR
jgi:UDP-N-acetylglucosamine 2-epimerase (non-hydrolysing)